MTEKEYRAHPAISRSELWKIRESPEKFKYYREHSPEPTPALVFGQLFHKMALQPTDVWSEFAVAPTCDRRTKKGREIWTQFRSNSEGKAIVTVDMVEQAGEMCRKLHEDPYCHKLLSGEKETPYFWTDELTGEACKCRCDAILFTEGDVPVVVDLKSTKCAEPNVFNYEIFKQGYHFQAAMYTEGVMKALGLTKRPEFQIIAQEKTPPYSVNRTTITEDVMLAGIDTYRELIGKYHECMETGYWYGYNGPFDEPNETYLPGYMSMGEKEEEE